MALQRGCQENKEKEAFSSWVWSCSWWEGGSSGGWGFRNNQGALHLCFLIASTMLSSNSCFPPFYRRANQESGNLRESGRCQGAHQFKPVSDLNALCVILFPKVESGLWGKSNFMSFAVSKGNAFPPSSQTSAVTAFVMCSWWPQMANCRLLCFRKGRDFCVYCLCTGTCWLLNTGVS